MRLHYYRRQGFKNFGDDLNPWLWRQLIPELLDDNPDEMFVGIGTLLNSNLPNAATTVVFGAGAGYGNGGLPDMTRVWRVYCVRGPLTARVLGLPRDRSVTDSALCIREVWKGAPFVRKSQWSFMPHAMHSQHSGWHDVCRSLGIGYIDPRNPVEEVLSAIQNSTVLLTEAMHGAVVADALRVPWVPVRTERRILEFKWHDWTQSLKLTYAPCRLWPVWQCPSGAHLVQQVRRWAKTLVVARQLKKVMRHARPVLSDRVVSQRAFEELMERLNLLKRDMAAMRTARPTPHAHGLRNG